MTNCETHIEESFDGGRSWQPASKGLKLPWPWTMVERFVQSGDRLFAILEADQGSRPKEKYRTGVNLKNELLVSIKKLLKR